MDDPIGLQGAGPSSTLERLAHNPNDPDVAAAHSRGRQVSGSTFLGCVATMLAFHAAIALAMWLL